MQAEGPPVTPRVPECGRVSGGSASCGRRRDSGFASAQIHSMRSCARVSYRTGFVARRAAEDLPSSGRWNRPCAMPRLAAIPEHAPTTPVGAGWSPPPARAPREGRTSPFPPTRRELPEALSCCPPLIWMGRLLFLDTAQDQVCDELGIGLDQLFLPALLPEQQGKQRRGGAEVEVPGSDENHIEKTFIEIRPEYSAGAAVGDQCPEVVRPGPGKGCRPSRPPSSGRDRRHRERRCATGRRPCCRGPEVLRDHAGRDAGGPGTDSEFEDG